MRWKRQSGNVLPQGNRQSQRGELLGFRLSTGKELEVRARIEYMKGKNARGDDDFDLVVFDLYDVIIDFLEKKHFLEKCYDFEKKTG